MADVLPVPVARVDVGMGDFFAGLEFLMIEFLEGAVFRLG